MKLIRTKNKKKVGSKKHHRPTSRPEIKGAGKIIFHNPELAAQAAIELARQERVKELLKKDPHFLDGSFFGM
jgi:hypothetical protein